MARAARSSRAALTVIVTLLAMFVLIAGVTTAVGIVNSVSRTALNPRPPEITTTIRQGALAETVSATISVDPLSTYQLHAGSGVVTRPMPAPGSALQEGEVVAVVNERPTFLFQGDVPMYRSLAPGDQGADVAQLQSALNRLGFSSRDKSGTFGKLTSLALNDFYKRFGFPGSTSDAAVLGSSYSDRVQTGLNQSEALFEPSVPLTFEGPCAAVGQAIPSDGCTLATSDVRANVHVAQSDAEQIKVGQVVHLTLDGATHDVTIAAADEAVSPKDQKEKTRAFSVAGDIPGLAIGQTGNSQIVIRSSSPQSLYVSSTAIRSVSGTSGWLESAAHHRIRVTIGLCHEGSCEVKGTGLAAGSTIELPDPLQ